MATKAAEVIDIEALVKKWAVQMFDYTKTKDQSKIPKEYRCFTINWSRVKFYHHEPQFDDKLKPLKPKSQVLFKTRFANSTNLEQEYTFKTERTTTSVCEVYVEKALTIGAEMSLSLKTPCEVFEAHAGFKREMTLTNAQGEVVEESLSWGVDSVIKVPPKTRTTAELIIYEDEFRGSFVVRTDVSGKVLVVVTNLKDNNSFVKTEEADISEIIRRASENGLKGVTIDSHGIASFVTQGHCHFRYGIEQHVQLQQEPLTST